MTRQRSIVAALVLAVGGVVGLTEAQPSNQPGTTTRNMQSQGSQMFRFSKKIDGADVYNTADKKVGEVEDFIVDRGSGRIVAVIVDTKRAVGADGKQLSVPWNSFSWANVDKRVMLNIDEARLAAMPVFDEDAWTGTRKYRPWAKKTDTSISNALAEQLAREAALAEADPYAEHFKTTPKTIAVKGTITSVDRRWATGEGEQTIVTLKTDDGKTRVVSLGPAWYTLGSAASPVRDQPYEVQVVELPTARGDVCCVATAVMVDGKPVSLRTTRGTFPWTDTETGTTTTTTTTTTMSSPSWSDRFLLLSRLKGDPVLARGVRCGKLHDTILEVNSGKAAFLCIDPDQNFLGIGDTKRMLPWSVASVTWDGTINVDATKDMVLRSPSTPSDLKTLDSGAYRDVYTAYSVPVPSFRAEITTDGR